MVNYFSKYVKYKAKYLALRETRTGGNTINSILSFNILNPEWYVTSIFFKASLDLKPRLANQLAMIDQKRFDMYRKFLIVEFLKKYENIIICLQEVNKQMLEELKARFKYIYHTNGKDILPRGGTKEEYRVIISPIELKAFEVELPYKNAIGCYINDKMVINVHLHFSLDNETMEKIINVLDGYKNSIIIGDFNKELADNIFNDFNKAHNEEYTFVENKKQVKYDNAISRDIKLNPLKVINMTEDNKNIIYDEKILYGKYSAYINPNMNEKAFSTTVTNIDFSTDPLDGNYLSDHKPILLTL